MKAMILTKPQAVEKRPLQPHTMPLPQPQSGQIRLRIRVCGVCHTDLHTVEGDLDLPTLPIIPGHQVVGTVEAQGPGATRHAVGQRVGVAWLNWACGECSFCQQGQENLCPQARFTGLHVHGGYAQRMIVDERYAYPLPGTFSDEAAAPLLCAGIVGYRALKLSAIQPQQRLGLYGFGASAHLVIQVARYWDCEVYVFTRSENHRQLAWELGAAWVGGAEEQPPHLLHSSIVFAPAGWIVHKALNHLRPRGTVAINAIHMSNIPELPYHLIYGERILRSVANFTRQDALEFLKVAAEIPIQTTVETFPLTAANEVLLRLKNSEIEGAAALRVAD